MATQAKIEVWLRGPLPNIPLPLNPVAHALLQAKEEVNDLMESFPNELLWQKPAGVASVGFHLRHMTGILDRLFTYANGQTLTTEQLKALDAEGKQGDKNNTVESLVQKFNQQVDKAIDQLSKTPEKDLLAARAVGKHQIPSTVFGLLIHAAEHTMRHLGQLLVTTRIVKG